MKRSRMAGPSTFAEYIQMSFDPPHCLHGYLATEPPSATFLVVI
jgi:hypothetical protein